MSDELEKILEYQDEQFSILKNEEHQFTNELNKKKKQLIKETKFKFKLLHVGALSILAYELLHKGSVAYISIENTFPEMINYSNLLGGFLGGVIWGTLAIYSNRRIKTAREYADEFYAKEEKAFYTKNYSERANILKAAPEIV